MAVCFVLSTFQVTLTSSGGTNYNWYTTDGLLCSNCSGLVVNPTKTTTYYVNETNTQCSEDSVTVYVLNCSDLIIPNAFSPNGDQINDVLFLQNDCIKNLDFKIYDRWGNVVFESNTTLLGWDGTNKGKVMDAGVFVYYVSATVFSGETITKKGNVSLIR